MESDLRVLGVPLNDDPRRITCWLRVSPSMAEVIARTVPIHKVRELGLYKHSHFNLEAMEGLKEDDPVPIDESCQVVLQQGIDEETEELQKFALARLPCGQWVYWEGRE